MRALIAGLGLASMLATGTAAAQLAPFNEAGVTMGHWHFASRDVECEALGVKAAGLLEGEHTHARRCDQRIRLMVVGLEAQPGGRTAEPC